MSADEAARVPERRRSVRKDPAGLGRQLASLEVVICCGSGGVGKTTVSAALALAIAAAEDKRVLVLTVDPARRLATALGIKGIGAEPVRIPKARLRRAGITVTGELEAAMLDMKQAWDRMIERYAPDRATARRILANPLYQRITDSFVGSHEYAAIEALYELHDAGEYDCIVVDTPPSRNALDFLEAPSRLTDYVGSRLLSLLSGGPSRFGFRAMNYAAAPFLRLADRLLGAEVLAEVSEFVKAAAVAVRRHPGAGAIRLPAAAQSADGFRRGHHARAGAVQRGRVLLRQVARVQDAAARRGGEPRASGCVS